MRSVVPLFIADHEEPFQRMIVPSSPAANTLLLELPQTAERFLDVGDAGVLQLEPFHRRMMPPWPTTQTSLALEPHTPASVFDKPVCSHSTMVPFQRTTVPSSPTPNTLFG